MGTWSLQTTQASLRVSDSQGMSESQARVRAASAGRSWAVADVEGEKREAIATFRTRLTRDLQEDKIDVPPLPRVALELHRLADSPDADLRKARILVERDPQLAGRVARLAASPAFGGRSVTGIEMAVVRLGTNGLRDIAMTVAMGKVFRCRELESYMHEQMRHSFVVASATAVGCKLLGMDRQYGYLCGLFHDVGRLIVGMAVAQYNKEDKTPVDLDVVSALADRYHEQVGGYILSKWGLHNMIKTVACSHHDPANAAAAAPLALIVAAADVAANLQAEDLASRVAQLSQLPQCYHAGLRSMAEIEELAKAVEDAQHDDVMSSLVA